MCSTRLPTDVIDSIQIAAAGLVVGLLYGGAVLGLAAAFRLMRFPDITVEGSFVLGASAWAAAVAGGCPPVLASTAALATGALCGVSTAALHDLLGIDRFLSGILTTASCFSLALLLLGTSNAGLFNAPSPFGGSYGGEASGVMLALAFATFASIIVLIFFSTRLGLRSRAASSNAPMFGRSIGPTFPYVAAGLAITNSVAALSGVVFARYQGFVDVGMGQGVLITSLAALAIGETLFRWRRLPAFVSLLLSVWAGSVLYQWALSTALSIGFPAATTKLVTAGIVVAFLAVQYRTRGSEEAMQ